MSQAIEDIQVKYKMKTLDKSSHSIKASDAMTENLQQNKTIEVTDWTSVLKKAFRDPITLLEYLHLNDSSYIEKVECDSQFKMLVPLSYAEKMKKGDWSDPLLRQVLPLKDESIKVKGFVSDPVGDLQAEVSPGLLHKYKGRMLLVTTGACPVHCRYCFRREYPYSESKPDKKHWQDTLSNIKNDKTVNEVIFSGGDPLMLSDERLQNMCEEVDAIDHVNTIRFHTRVPIFLPERISPEFVFFLSKLKSNLVMVIHCNHANELDELVIKTLNELKGIGVTLLNQSVLLKGVNDSVEDLEALSKRLFNSKVLPYYIHQLDRVEGSAHFEVDEECSIKLIEQLKNQLPGYLVPKLVKEVSGERSKQTIVKMHK